MSALEREELRWAKKEKYAFPYAVTKPTEKECDTLWSLPDVAAIQYSNQDRLMRVS